MNETERIAALHRSGLLDSNAEQAYDDITTMAAAICGVPIALVSLVDTDRQWFKSKFGLNASETHRELAFCAHAIHDSAPFIVPDALRDERFCNNPLVTGNPMIRFYAGFPLADPDGMLLGTLCVIDRQPRELSPEQRQFLIFLAKQVSTLIALRIHVEIARREIAHRVQVEEEMIASEQRFRHVIEHLAEGVYLIDNHSGKVVQANSAFEAMLGYSGEDLFQLRAKDLFTGEDEDSIRRTELAAAAGLARDGRFDLGRRVYRRKDSGTLEVCVQLGSVPQGESGLTSVIVRDITEQRRYEDRLEEYQRELEIANAALQTLATTDGLTGAKNRTAFNKRIDHEIDRAQRYGRSLSLLLMDVDHFKHFNDTFGHPAGDDVLRTVGGVLEHAMRETDFFARYGGEEFVVILPETDRAGALVIAERCRKLVADCDWPKRAITVSVGISTLAGAEADAAVLLEEADLALYRSKKHGRNRVTQAEPPP